jgi:hypothetical protein
MLEELATQRRGLALLYLDLLHACTWDACSRLCRAWTGARRCFWQEFAERAALAPSLAAGGWWHGYIVAELAYSVALGTLTLPRAAAACACAACSPAASPAVATPATVRCLPLRWSRCNSTACATTRRCARAAWMRRRPRLRTAAGGARRAGIDASRHRRRNRHPAHHLSYRYPTQRDLVIAGLESIVAHIRFAVDADSLTGTAALAGGRRWQAA